MARDEKMAWHDALYASLERPRGVDLYSKRGARIVFAFPENGYDHDRTTARKYLLPWKTYTVERTEVGECHTDVYLVEVPNIAFNSVLFVDEADLPKEPR